MGLRNQKGSSLVSIMVGVGIMSIVMFTMTNQMSLVSQLNRKQNMVSSLEIVRSQLTATILNDNAWQRTMSANSNMSCLRNSSTNCTAGKRSFALRDANGTEVVSTGNSKTARKKGYNAEGLPCSSFPDQNKTNDLCPFKFSLSWEPICGSTCNNPTVNVTGDVIYRGGNVFGGFNTARFKINLIRERVVEDFSDALRRELANMGCKNGQALGFNKKGEAQCMTIPVAQAPAPAPVRQPARAPAPPERRTITKSCKSKTSTNCRAYCPSGFRVTGCNCNGTSWLQKCVKSGNGCNGPVKITRTSGGPWDWTVRAYCEK